MVTIVTEIEGAEIQRGRRCGKKEAMKSLSEKICIGKKLVHTGFRISTGGIGV